MAVESVTGAVPEGWDLLSLGDVIAQSEGGSIQTGPFGSQLHASDYVPVGIPTIMPVNIGENKIVETGIARITEADANRLSKHRVLPGDIIYSRRGDVERRALIREHERGWFCGTGCLKVRLGRGPLDPLFTSFYLGHPSVRAWIVRHAVGATMPNLNTDIMSAIPMLIPPRLEQRAIAAVLGALDDKIEVNRRQGQVLEAIARTVFQAWFVGFDPVRRAVAGEPTGLPGDVAAHFPKRLVNSPIGEVPEGWRVEPMGSHFEAVKGLSYKGAGLADDGMPMHNLNSVYEGGGYKYPGIKYYNGEYRDRHIVRPGDVIVANTEQGHDHLLIGFPAIVPRRFGEKGLFSHHLYRVRPKPETYLTNHYIYQAMMTSRLRDEIAGHTNGTTVNMLSVSGLEMPLILVPPEPLVKRYESIVKPLFERVEVLHDSTPNLAAIRDVLLPKLISGEIRLAAKQTAAGRAN